MVDIALVTAIFAYVATLALIVVATLGRSAVARSLASGMVLLTWLAHAGAMALAVAGGRASLGGFFLVGGWVVLTLHLYLWFVRRVEGAGWVLPPIALVATVAALALDTQAVGGEEAPAAWLLVHVALSALGFGVLCLAFAMSLLFLAQDHALKSRRSLALVERLPALREADRIGLWGVGVGFVLLTAGIATGFVTGAGAGAGGGPVAAKLAFSFVAWLLFAGVLVARPLLGVQGRRSAYLTIAGFAFGVLTVVGMVI